ncbi:ABC transporter permease [Microvirga sp. BT689]|uniref:ABC transporter permease n=1 Tax=Microvirga arvi TaxID=2778731 RepID=UPI0019500B0B|nr:ABC transporter permease [Microvirga arvi]MBM6582436.1 ABC transporter permease [Microvirga arvi]
MKNRPTTLLLLLPAALLVGLLFVLPILGVLSLSVYGDSGFTLGPIRELVGSRVSLVVLERTFWQALTVSVICVVLGYPAAFFMSGLSTKLRAYLVYLILLPFWISILVRTYTWIIILGREGIINRTLAAFGFSPVQILYTDLAVRIAMVQILLPIVVLTCLASMLDIDKGLVKTARSLGATPTQAFVKVFLPLSLSGAATGGIICFILCLGFYVTPALLGGRRSILISNLIDIQVHQSLNWGFAAALATALLIITLACLALFRLLTRGRTEFSSLGVGR